MHFIQLDNRYIPFHSITSINDDGAQIIISLREDKTGPGEFRIRDEEADKLRIWLAQCVAVSLKSQNKPEDSGYREDD